MHHMDATFLVSDDGQKIEVIHLFAGVRKKTVARLDLTRGAKELKQDLQQLAELVVERDPFECPPRGPFPRWLGDSS